MGTRSRPIPATRFESKLTVTSRRLDDPPSVPSSITSYAGAWSEASRNLEGRQVTVSESHPSWKHRHKHAFKDIGGPFYTSKRYAEVYPLRGHASGSWTYPQWNSRSHGEYEGPVLAVDPAYVKWPDPAESSKDDLLELGTTAISRCSPSNPVADLSTFLGEVVKDGIPALIGSTLRGLRGMNPAQRRQALGKEHLNVEFGWKPFVGDLKKLSRGIVNADAIWAQYERDSGKLVRRRYEFPEVVDRYDEDLGEIGPFYSPSISIIGSPIPPTPHGRVHRSVTTTKRQWFSGAFMYYVPDEDRETVAYNVIQAKKCLGLSLTPDVVWNLMPWSWALDWFGNTGDILQNWSNWAIDGQVLVYGYMMETSITECIYSFSGSTGFQSSSTPGIIRLVIETKQRVQAGPYGFGTSFDGLTNRQAGIVAALGLTKSK